MNDEGQIVMPERWSEPLQNCISYGVSPNCRDQNLAEVVQGKKTSKPGDAVMGGQGSMVRGGSADWFV